MLQNLQKKFQLKHLVLFGQILIFSIAFFSYLINRGDTYRKTFFWNELDLARSVVVEENISVSDLRFRGGTFLETPPLALKKGVYTVEVEYIATATGSTIFASSNRLADVDIKCNPAELSPSEQKAYLTFELARDAEDIVIECSFSGSGTLTINDLYLCETTGKYTRNIFYALLLCVALGLGYYFLQSDRSRRQVMLALSGIFLFSCYPLFTDYLLVGHDLPFHLLRIEGIATGLSQGIFPVKIHPLWAEDYGYAVGVFYGDFALYLPAVLRLLGFSVQTSYQYFVALIQLATVLVSYFTFKRMFRSRRIGVLGSLLYSLSLYRLADVYTRASVGEYTALVFFPMVLCGFYLIFTDNTKQNWWKHSMLTAFGLTGLIQSHLLSCEMTAFFIIVLCIIMIRRVIKPYNLLALSSGAILTVLLNLGFLVPFLNYFNEDIMILSPEWTGGSDGAIQNTGLFPLQIFSFFQHSNGGTWSTTSGIHSEATFGMGIIFLIGMGLFLYLLACHRKECAANRLFLPACVSFGLGCLALWMSTCYFPWNQLADSGEFLYTMINSLQFPWRMLAPATALLTFVTCFAFSQLSRIVANQTPAIIVACVALLLVNIGWYFYDFCFTGTPYRVYDTYDLNTMAMYSYDYLPAGTDPDEMIPEQIFTEGIQAMDYYEKEGTKILCHIVAEDCGGWVDFPLNYYKDYRCVVRESGEELKTSAGTNNMVRVSVPGGFTGIIEVSFQEPLHWRICELLSLLTLMGCATTYCFWIFKEKSLRSKEKLGL